MKINKNKLKLIDISMNKNDVKSFADFGGVWGVDAGYTFHILDNHVIEKAFLIDDIITPVVKEKAKKYEHLNLINGKFGDSKTLKQVSKIDLILFFDVLLHQVNPNWDDIIKLCSEKTKSFCVYNQQWLGKETVRFPEMSEDDYNKHVHISSEHPEHSKLNKKHPTQKIAWKDMHYIWQWGITDDDLISCFNKNGFELKYYENFGKWKGLPNIENHGFVFVKKLEK